MDEKSRTGGFDQRFPSSGANDLTNGHQHVPPRRPKNMEAEAGCRTR